MPPPIWEKYQATIQRILRCVLKLRLLRNDIQNTHKIESCGRLAVLAAWGPLLLLAWADPSLLCMAGAQAHASVDSFVGLCPLLFLAADEDVSLDDSVRCAKLAQEAVSSSSSIGETDQAES
eukprot:COSAG02_NODE_2439_length_8861_cov_85.579548_4_plen_122_part_00